MFFEFALNDIFDIFLVAFIIYRILILIKDTRIFQMLWGVPVFFILLWTARLLDLHTLHYMLNNIIGYLVLTFVILFHPEIRKGLSTIGQNSIFSLMKSQNNQSEYYKEIIASLNFFKNNKIGSLISIQRKINIEKYITMGTILDSEISKEMIQTIFFPNSPLHDGSIIIKENRIYAAGCILPMTRQENLDQRFGSRHRAALGLSEETDAIVIIVSEETGRISIAETGILKVNLSAEEVEAYLKEKLLKEDEDEN